MNFLIFIGKILIVMEQKRVLDSYTDDEIRDIFRQAVEEFNKGNTGFNNSGNYALFKLHDIVYGFYGKRTEEEYTRIERLFEEYFNHKKGIFLQ